MKNMQQNSCILRQAPEMKFYDFVSQLGLAACHVVRGGLTSHHASMFPVTGRQADNISDRALCKHTVRMERILGGMPLDACCALFQVGLKF